MKKKTNLIIYLVGLITVLQGCCYDSEEVDISFSNKTSEPISVQMQLARHIEGDIVGTMELIARPWSFVNIAPDSTYKWKRIGVSNDEIELVLIKQSTINSHDSIYLASHCLYDSIINMSMPQLQKMNYHIEYKQSNGTVTEDR